MAADFLSVTDAQLAQARRDPGYRRRLLAASLEQLLAELNRRKRDPEGGAMLARQLREGSLLAIKLADLITRLEERPRR